MKKNSVKLSQKKVLLREKNRSKLRSLSAKTRRKKSETIASRLFRTQAFKQAKAVLLYSSMASEVQTRALIRESIRQEKKIFLPKVTCNHRLEIYEVRHLKKDLIRGYQNIWEPRAIQSRKGNVSKMDLIVVPGLGFTRKGKRLGRGGGYYDRLLGKAKKSYKIGIAFKEQLCSRIPTDRRDQTVNRVITD